MPHKMHYNNMSQHGEPYIFVTPDHPNKVFAESTYFDIIMFRVTDATWMNEAQLLHFKSKNPNYAATEVSGRYYVLTISMAVLRRPLPDDDNELARQVNDIQLKAADFWHDHIIANQN